MLVIAPHPDSGGIGGGACLNCRRGDSDRVDFLTSGEQQAPGPEEEVKPVGEDQARAAGTVLGLGENLEGG